MGTLKFLGFQAEVSNDELTQDVFDIDFGGQMMVRFAKQEDGTFEAINAMDGWGNNCYNQIADNKVIIE